MTKQAFSTHLEQWLKSKQSKTLGSLEGVFGEKSFAMLFLLLMFLPALPIPTGGITHVVLLPATMLVALEMIIGRRSLWLPRRFKSFTLGERTIKKALPFMIRRVRWFEKRSRPRFSHMLDKPVTRSAIGLLVFVLTLSAFVAPPFSGLDTLPSLGVVIIALAMILEDAALLLAGAVVGSAGIALIIGLGSAITKLIEHLF